MARALRRLPAFGLLVACVAAAGCLQGSTPEPPPAAMVPPGAPQDLSLGGCVGFHGTTPLLPNAASPARPPPGWEMPATQPASSIGLLAFDCKRISVGPFERGPVRLVADTHTRFAAPAACVADARPPTFTFILHALVVDDPELAGHLRAAYGLPAVHGEIDAAADAAGAWTRHTWTWGEPGAPPSDLTFIEDGDRQADRFAHRMFWARGSGIGSLDLGYDRQAPSVAGLAGAGTMREPMLLATLPGGQYAGSISYYTDLSAQGVFRLYRDAACQELEP